MSRSLCRKRRLEGFDEQIISLYARGITMSDADAVGSVTKSSEAVGELKDHKHQDSVLK